MSNKKALLIIDMQNDILEYLVKPGKEIIQPIQMLKRHFNANEHPIIYINRDHRENGVDIDFPRVEGFLKKPIIVQGTLGQDVVKELKPQKDDYQVTKKRFSGFFHTELLLLLSRLSVKSLVICGVQTPNSIRGTATDAISYDFDVTVVEDASTALTPEVHQTNLSDMRNMGIKVQNVQEILQA